MEISVNKTDIPQLPKKGEAITVEELLGLAHWYGKVGIVKMLEDSPPDGDFVSDGCSKFPDVIGDIDIYTACYWHDAGYWCGLPGDDITRACVDAQLVIDVALLGLPDLARIMFTAVGVGGSEIWKTSFRWGYGRVSEE